MEPFSSLKPITVSENIYSIFIKQKADDYFISLSFDFSPTQCALSIVVLLVSISNFSSNKSCILFSHSSHDSRGGSSLMPAITYKIFETNSIFHVKQRTMGKVQFLFFKSFLLLLIKLSFWQGAGHWAIIPRIFDTFLIFLNFLRS